MFLRTLVKLLAEAVTLRRCVSARGADAARDAVRREGRLALSGALFEVTIDSENLCASLYVAVRRIRQRERSEVEAAYNIRDTAFPLISAFTLKHNTRP